LITFSFRGTRLELLWFLLWFQHLVYALLERKHVFNPLRHNVEFAELLENIDRVLEHFGRTVVIDDGVDAQERRFASP
jgi:hypothetical protein